jgi:1-aminocyclopropane-1-carboxylate deaminase/D-cysteine desulfhydrase-like pyridoxal-dependent ACC family enzyme
VNREPQTVNREPVNRKLQTLYTSVSVSADRATFERLLTLPRLPLTFAPTPIDDLSRLRAALGGGPTLLVKRDDAIPFGFGGNKIRKLQVVAAHALAGGADTLITCGGVQSNHARATAAVAARMGLGCVLVVNGAPPARPTANALLDRLLGADVRYVASREERASSMEVAAESLRSQGRRPFVIPLGASTPLGAAAYALAVNELLGQIAPPDLIILSTSSGGTQAGILAGCHLRGLTTRVLGVSADDPAPVIATEIRRILAGLETLIDVPAATLTGASIEIDDGFVGEGYGIPTPRSTEAIELCARSEALFLDPTYTAKAMAALIAKVRAADITTGTVVFWHTGGQVGLFA